MCFLSFGTVAKCIRFIAVCTAVYMRRLVNKPGNSSNVI